MDKRKTLLPVLAILAGTLVTANLTLAQEPGMLPQGMPHMEREKVKPMRPYNIPDLTTDQLAKIQKLQLKHQKAVLPLQAQLQTKRLELYSLIIEDATWEKINTKIEEIGKIRADLQKKQVAHHVAIRKLLTDEQKVYFDARELGHRGGFVGPKGPCGSRR